MKTVSMHPSINLDFTFRTSLDFSAHNLQRISDHYETPKCSVFLGRILWPVILCAICLAPVTSLAALNQTISGFGPFANVDFTQSQAYNFYRPTASSGLIVNVRVASGPATLTLYTNYSPHLYYLSFSGVGTVVMEASQAGSADYNPVSVTNSIVVANGPSPTPTPTPTPSTKMNQTISGGGAVAGASYTLHNSVWSVSYFRDSLFKFKASSGLPVTMSIKSGPATIISNELYISGPGTIAFAANQSGDNSYNPAPEVTGSWTLSASDWSTSNKRLLCIAADFPDRPATSVSSTDVANLIGGSVSASMQEFSYGKVALVATAGPQSVFRLPSASSVYKTNSSQLVTDAQSLLSASGINASSYDILVIHHGSIGASYWGSGTQTFLLLQQDTLVGPGIPLHELGHSLGVRHAHSWKTYDGSVMGSNGYQDEYGDHLDQMGASEPWAHYNPVFKRSLGWLDDKQFPTVSSGSGVYRIYRFDTKTPKAGAPLALTVQYGSSEKFVLGVRRNRPENASFSNGLYVLWDYNPNRMETRLLDMTPNSQPGYSDVDDGALALNKTFIDPTGLVKITPVANGGSGDTQWMDVYISLGANSQAVDTDGDGLSDLGEIQMAVLGFDWQVAQPALVQTLLNNANFAGLYFREQLDNNRTFGQADVTTNPSIFNLFAQIQYDANRATGRSDVIANPASYGLYTSNSIMDLRIGGLMIQRQGTNAVVSFQPQTTTDLTLPFTNNGTPITNTVPMPGNKGFLRINAKPEQSAP